MELLGNSVLILPDELEEKTAGGVILNKAVSEPPNSGTVVGTGPMCKELNAGDRISYPRKLASIMVIKDIEHHLIFENQINYVRIGE